jgi:hypothetical protein
LLALTAAGWSLVVMGALASLGAVAVLRVLTRDRFIRRARFGIFYEREREDEPDERRERLARKDERP